MKHVGTTTRLSSTLPRDEREFVRCIMNSMKTERTVRWRQTQTLRTKMWDIGFYNEVSSLYYSTLTSSSLRLFARTG